MKDKQITITFNATEKNFDKKIDAIKGLFKAHDLMQLEYGDINIEGHHIKIDKLVSCGGM